MADVNFRAPKPPQDNYFKVAIVAVVLPLAIFMYESWNRFSAEDGAVLKQRIIFLEKRQIPPPQVQDQLKRLERDVDWIKKHIREEKMHSHKNES